MGRITKLNPPSGATVKKDRLDGCFRADSPVGKVWNATDAHQVIADFTDVVGEVRKGYTEAARVRLQADMDAGLRDCDVARCDVCADEKKDAFTGKTPDETMDDRNEWFGHGRRVAVAERKACTGGDDEITEEVAHLDYVMRAHPDGQADNRFKENMQPFCTRCDSFLEL